MEELTEQLEIIEYQITEMEDLESLDSIHFVPEILESLYKKRDELEAKVELILQEKEDALDFLYNLSL